MLEIVSGVGVAPVLVLPASSCMSVISHVPASSADCSGGISYGHTNSDIEALRRAYHHMDQSMGDTNEPKTLLNVAENTISTFPDALNTEEKVAKNTSNTESDLPTVEELMKPIRENPAFPRGFALEPASHTPAAGRRLEQNEIQLASDELSARAEKIRDGLLQEWRRPEESLYHPEAASIVRDSGEAERLIREHLLDNVHPVIPKPRERHSDAFLPPGKGHHQVSHHPLNLWEIYAVNNKQVTFKTKSSSALPKKPQGGLYASIRSSGYGKTSSSVKQAASSGEKLTAKEAARRSNVKKNFSPDQPRKKGPLSPHKTVGGAKKVPDFKFEDSPAASPYIRNSELQVTRPTNSNLEHINVPVDITENIHGDYSSLNMIRPIQKELVLRKVIEDLESKWRQEHLLLEHMRKEFSEKEFDLEQKMKEMKEQQERELMLLKQDNYILQTKLHSGKEMSEISKRVLEELKDPITEERFKEIQKQIKEQEELLQGYQQENEKLYHQVKELQSQNKKNEERMFHENQNLLAELANVKEQKANRNLHQQMEQGTEQIKNQTFTELISELRAAQKVQADLLEEVKQLKLDKQCLEVDIGQIRKERDLAKAQIIHTSGDKSYEMKIMEESYKQEISRLNKRLQWFAENQELLDKDASRLRDASKEIEMLQIEVHKLKMEAGNRSEQQQKRLKERTGDAKRIQDLERQVKEMEAIIKKRHPNSLPALIYAAAAADDSSTAKPHATLFLERRIQKLESELEGKDEDAKKSLRSMEQQFQKVKIQYEQRIMELEQMLASKSAKDIQKGQDQQASRLVIEQDLISLKEAHQNTEAHLLREIEMLKKRNSELEIKNGDMNDKEFLSIEQQIEQANMNARLVRLNQELVAKTKEVQGLYKTVERLQKERMSMLSDHTSSTKIASKPKAANKAKQDLVPPAKEDSKNTDQFPTTLDEKAYQPHNFAETHISEVLRENETLKSKLERMSETISHQKTQCQTAIAHAESNLRRANEEAVKQITALKLSHQRELEKIICQHAIEHSASRVAELSSKSSSQEILIKHLQEQVNELQRDRESLARLQIREDILQKEVAKLLEELREAKESHSPQMKHFLALENKIRNMENRHAQREMELQQVIRQTRTVVEEEQTQEVEKWKALAHSKNQELQQFRIELDSILDVLRELQRQGVVIPARDPAPPNPPGTFWNA
ncbi:centrosomal protein of 162 kDa isoform X2 [Lissotriton helveticus]